LRDSTQQSIASLRDSTQQSIASLRDSTQQSIAGLQASIASVQASVEALRATVKTIGWGISVAGMLAVIFFTAGKSLHWFEPSSRQDTQPSMNDRG
jgi:hypothetical protein